MVRSPMGVDSIPSVALELVTAFGADLALRGNLSVRTKLTQSRLERSFHLGRSPAFLPWSS